MRTVIRKVLYIRTYSRTSGCMFHIRLTDVLTTLLEEIFFKLRSRYVFCHASSIHGHSSTNAWTLSNWPYSVTDAQLWPLYIVLRRHKGKVTLGLYDWCWRESPLTPSRSNVDLAWGRVVSIVVHKDFFYGMVLIVRCFLGIFIYL